MSRYWVNNLRFGNQVFQTQIKARSLYKSYLVSYIIVVLGLVISFVAFSYGINEIETRMALPNGELPEVAVALQGGLIFGLGLLNLLVWVLAMSFYYAEYISQAISETSVNGCLFYARLGPMKLLGFQLVNLMIMIVTFGLFYPFIMSRYMSFISENVKARGIESLEQTIQIERDELKKGEGLADALDVGAF